MPDVLRTAILKIRTPSITIINRWQDPGETGQKYSLNLQVEKLEVDAGGFRKQGSTLSLGQISLNPQDPAVAVRQVTITDPVLGTTNTISAAGISVALEAWISDLLNETYP